MFPLAVFHHWPLGVQTKASDKKEDAGIHFTLLLSKRAGLIACSGEQWQQKGAPGELRVEAAPSGCHVQAQEELSFGSCAHRRAQ